MWNGFYVKKFKKRKGKKEGKEGLGVAKYNW